MAQFLDAAKPDALRLWSRIHTVEENRLLQAVLLISHAWAVSCVHPHTCVWTRNINKCKIRNEVNFAISSPHGAAFNAQNGEESGVGYPMASQGLRSPGFRSRAHPIWNVTHSSAL